MLPVRHRGHVFVDFSCHLCSFDPPPPDLWGETPFPCPDQQWPLQQGPPGSEHGRHPGQDPAAPGQGAPRLCGVIQSHESPSPLLSGWHVGGEEQPAAHHSDTPRPPRGRGSGSLCPGRAMGSGSCGPPSTLSWVSHCRVCVPGGGGALSPRAGSPHGAGPHRVGPVSRSGECAGGHRRGQWRSARAPQGLSPRRARGCQEGPGLGATAPAAQHRCRGEVGSPKCSS